MARMAPLLDVKDHDRTRSRLVFGDRRNQLPMREILQTSVEGQLQVAAGPRLAQKFHILDDAAQPVLNDPFHAGLAGQPAVIGQLEPFLPDFIDIGHTQDLGTDLPGRIETLVFALKEYAGNFEPTHPLGQLGAYAADDPDELAVGPLAQRR